MRNPLPKPEAIQGYHKHHVYGGSRRKFSEKYNCVIYLPPHLHTGRNGIHFNKVFMDTEHIRFQTLLEDNGWTRDEFMETFGRNYL